MNQSQYRGTPVVPGIVDAPAKWVSRPVLPELSHQKVPEPLRPAQRDRFLDAADTVAARMEARAEAATGTVAELMAMSAALARDTAWRTQICDNIDTGTPALTAVVEVTDAFVGLFTRAGGNIAERVADLRDMHDRVVAELQGLPEPGMSRPESPVVLLANDLSPADTATLDPEFVRAFVVELSGPTSHTAIIVRQLGIPCVVACKSLQHIKDGDRLLVDGGSGDIWVNPDDEFARTLVERDQKRRERAKNWHGPAHLADNREVQLLANIQDGGGAKIAAQMGANGVGLLRTELMFLRSSTEPTCDVQAAAYTKVFESFPNSKVVVRTLDFGSDKPINWANNHTEENPALGVRGIRLERHNNALIDNQIHAIMQAASDLNREGETWVMAPMITTVEEAESFATRVREAALEAEIPGAVKAGVMIEVPAVAIMADRLMPLVDFVSIGTNDLAQYVMAADRLNPTLADLNDMWQPAVLRLIAAIAATGREHGVPVGICGEAAADPLLACVFLGMGVTSLSAACAALPQVGALLETVTTDQCKAAAEAVLQAVTPREARFAAAAVIMPGN